MAKIDVKRRENSGLCRENGKVSPKNRSDTVQALVDVLGFDRARHVMERLGGMTWRFEASARGSLERSAIAARVGEATYQQLQKHFKGEALYIPKGTQNLMRARNQSIRQTLAQCAAQVGSKTKKIRELVEQHRLSARRIQQIAAQSSYSESLHSPA